MSIDYILSTGNWRSNSAKLNFLLDLQFNLVAITRQARMDVYNANSNTRHPCRKHSSQHWNGPWANKVNILPGLVSGLIFLPCFDRWLLHDIRVRFILPDSTNDRFFKYIVQVHLYFGSQIILSWSAQSIYNCLICQILGTQRAG